MFGQKQSELATGDAPAPAILSARSLLAICALWPVVMGVRTVAMLLTAVATGFSGAMVTPTFVIAGVLSLLIDLTIYLPGRSNLVRRALGDGFPAMLSALVCASTASFAFALVSLVAGHHEASTLVGLMALLGTLLPTLAVLVPHRMLMFLTSMATGLGVLLAAWDLRFALGTLVFLPAMLLVALIRSKDDRDEEAALDEQKLNNERARCLLSDYEKSGRGWFWETDRQARISYISAAAGSPPPAGPATTTGPPPPSWGRSPPPHGGRQRRPPAPGAAPEPRP
ncbi:MAG: diguanylate cyclase, partial [Blastomonas sp.]|nr:diguanylate cyclase [Blastomonas sp.]